jgi:hypothetical protein
MSDFDFILGTWRPASGAYTHRRFHVSRIEPADGVSGRIHAIGREDGLAVDVCQPIGHLVADWLHVGLCAAALADPAAFRLLTVEALKAACYTSRAWGVAGEVQGQTVAEALAIPWITSSGDAAMRRLDMIARMHVNALAHVMCVEVAK